MRKPTLATTWLVACGVEALLLSLSARAHAQGVDAGRSWGDCTVRPSNDRDNDGFDDGCEAALAFAFRPRLLLSSADEAPARRSYWAAMPTPPLPGGAPRPSAVRIFYALAYLRDPGVPDIDSCAGGAVLRHNGDPEFVALDVEWAGGTQWRLVRGFLSAHYRSLAGGVISLTDASGWFAYGQFSFLAEDRGRPNLYVSRNKHANYASLALCTANTWAFDHCDADSPSDVLEPNCGVYVALGH